MAWKSVRCMTHQAGRTRQWGWCLMKDQKVGLLTKKMKVHQFPICCARAKIHGFCSKAIFGQFVLDLKGLIRFGRIRFKLRYENNGTNGF